MKNKETGRGASNIEIVITVPVELKHFIGPFQEMLDKTQDLIRSGRGGNAIDYAAVEKEVQEQAAKIERASHTTILQSYEMDFPQVVIKGKTYTRINHAPGTYRTLAGPVIVERALYREDGERNAKVVDVINLRTGAIERGWLPRTAEAMAFMIQQGTSREAEKMADLTGRLPYSRMSFERISHKVGDRYLTHQADIEDLTIQAFEIPEETCAISVGLDRVSIPMEEAAKRPVGRPKKGAPKRPINRVYRMAYCASVTLYDTEGRAIHTFRYGTMPETDIYFLCWRMANDVSRMKEKRPDLDLILLADGAHEMWNLLEVHFPEEIFGKRHQFVDFWHLIEKLSPAAKVIYGATEGQEILKHWRRRLLEKPKAVDLILRELRDSGYEFVQVQEKKPVHEAITYLENHAEEEDRMNYAAAKKQNLPIGSGNVEATCKSLVEMRMKRAGSRWKTWTAEHVLQLRSLALSDRWDPAMKLLHAHYRTSVRPAA